MMDSKKSWKKKYAKIRKRGKEVFEDEKAFLLWLQRYNICMGGRPMDYHVDIILDELGQIEHGIPC